MGKSSGRSFPFIITFIAVLVFYLLFSFAQKTSLESPRILHPTPPSSTPTVIPTPSREDVLSETENAVFVPVVRVVDGDTIVVSLNGRNETVRLIGVNTPETVDPRRGLQCFGREASAKAKEHLTDTSVRLVADPTQSDRDRYLRLLRYVYLPDGTLFNQLMIEEGYAYEYTYNTPYQFQEEFKTAQESAMRQQKGLWSSQTCSGKV